MRIAVCYDSYKTPQAVGGYADVWKGSHEGKDVAAKVLRVYSSSDFDKIRKVCSARLLALTEKLIVPYAVVLQGGRDMERTPSSERAAVGRRDDGGEAFRDGLGVDAQWKYHPVSGG